MEMIGFQERGCFDYIFHFTLLPCFFVCAVAVVVLGREEDLSEMFA